MGSGALCHDLDVLLAGRRDAAAAAVVGRLRADELGSLLHGGQLEGRVRGAMPALFGAFLTALVTASDFGPAVADVDAVVAAAGDARAFASALVAFTSQDTSVPATTESYSTLAGCFLAAVTHRAVAEVALLDRAPRRHVMALVRPELGLSIGLIAGNTHSSPLQDALITRWGREVYEISASRVGCSGPLDWAELCTVVGPTVSIPGASVLWEPRSGTADDDATLAELILACPPASQIAAVLLGDDPGLLFADALSAARALL